MYIHQIPTYIKKSVQTVKNLCKVPTENGLKLEMYVCCIQTIYKLHKTYTTS